MNRYIYITCALLLLSCYQRNFKKRAPFEKKEGNITLIGEMACDSLFDGIVKYYDSLGKYMGYSTYSYGKKEGCEVSYYMNGKPRDSSFYTNDLRNGFAYHFNDSGRLIYKGYYLNDRPFGPDYWFDEQGNIDFFGFKNFECKFIFQSKIENSRVFKKGDEIQGSKYTKALPDDKEIDVLLLYIILSPFVKSHYELAVLNEKKEFITSEVIEWENYFYERDLTDLPKGQSYAIVLHTYNASKGKDDLTVRIIE